MENKGQITIFVILGIVIIALVVLVVMFRGEIYTPATSGNLNSKMNEVKRELSNCLLDVGEEYVTRIGLQGGYLTPPSGSYRLWNDTTISYLCYKQEGKRTCINRMLTEKEMEDQLAKAIEEAFPTCDFDLEDIKPEGVIKSYTVDLPTQPPKFKVDVAQSAVFVEMEYPITFESESGGESVSEDKFTAKIDAPLGELYGVSQDILDAETTIGMFDVLTYVLSKTGRYTIYPSKPYPDKIYQIKLREGDYFFQFAVEGEAS
ncbi:MAG: hypothetical protein ABIB71_01375 [Candidatus Woesearchaeota archaeon]